MKKIKIILCPLFIITASLLNAQTFSISGSVTNNDDSPLIGANIFLENTVIGTAADEKGEFVLSGLQRGGYRLIVSMIGYQKFFSGNILLDSDINDFKISLSPVTYRSEQVIVTAAKHEQNLIDLPVSASLISSDQFSKKNYRSLDRALRFVPGVVVTLDQVSIRGSSGYSRGAGSRVLVAFDGIPIYTGDSGEIIWELIPPYEIERVEIIKGAASSLYGSTAIGGVINLIPKTITANPLTFVKSYFGFYSKPSHAAWDWSDKTRTYNGISVSHSQKFGRLGISLSAYRNEDYAYRQNDYDRRIGGYLKLKYTFSEKSSVELWSTGYNRQRETFNFWKDIDNVLSPPDEDLGDSQPSNRQIFGMTYNQVVNEDFSFSIKPSIYRTHWQDETFSNNTSTALLYRAEVKSIYKFTRSSLLISGIEAQSGNVESNIFGNNSANAFGAFVQYEHDFKFPLKSSVGIRYDISKLENLESESSFSPKLGFNYKLNPLTVFRASISAGFRSPTLAEAFTSTIASGITVKPNPEIKSERNFSFEFGINYSLFSNLNLDVAVFQSEYYDLIEPKIDVTDITVVFSNLTRARILGLELNTVIDILPQYVSVSLGYNYLWARDIEKRKALRYRPRHLFMSSLDLNYGIVNIGADFRFASKFEEIDFELVEFGLVPNGDQRVSVKVLDIRAGVNLFNIAVPLRAFVNANNVLNYNYVEMIGNVAPIRNYSISLEWLF